MFSTLVISGALRAAIVLLVGLGACAALGRASAATRRALLVLALGAAVIVPVAAAIAPSWRVEAPAALSPSSHESALEGAVSARTAAAIASPTVAAVVARPAADGSHVDLTSVLLAIWLVGAALLLARTLAAHLRARQLARRGELLPPSAAIATTLRDAGVTGPEDGTDGADGVAIRLCPGIESPAVTGLVRATVLLPLAAAAWCATRSSKR